MKNTEHSAAASCESCRAGSTFAPAFTDGTSGNYTVTVAPGGKSYQVG